MGTSSPLPGLACYRYRTARARPDTSGRARADTSAKSEDALQVGGGDRDAAAVIPVPLTGELGQVGGQRGAAVLVEGLEGFDRGPVPAAEVRHEVLRRGEPQREGAPYGAGLSDRTAK